MVGCTAGPYCYWGQTVDHRAEYLVAKGITWDYALGGHTASLGLCWLPAGTSGCPAGMVMDSTARGIRSTLSGYKAVLHSVREWASISCCAIFSVASSHRTRRCPDGRPVTLGPDGSLLVADDVGDVIRASRCSSRTRRRAAAALALRPFLVGVVGEAADGARQRFINVETMLIGGVTISPVIRLCTALAPDQVYLALVERLKSGR